MEFKKNQIVELYIDDIGNEGEGIGHIDGYALFLKDAVIGDKVRASRYILILVLTVDGINA